MSPSDEATHLHRTTVRHTLSARFVEIDQPATEEFECGGVIVRVDARVRQSTSFATIVCSGTVEREAADASVDPGQYLPFLSSDGLPSAHTNEVHSAWSRIEPVLQHVGDVLRWRFGMFGDDPLWTATDIVLQVNGEVDELTPIPQAAMGDDIARITSNGLSHVAELVGDSTMQPLAHEMWREAWNLRHSNPRSSLVVGVAAAEVGFKHLVSSLVPAAAAMVEHVPSPPLDTMIRKVLPDLPVREFGQRIFHGKLQWRNRRSRAPPARPPVSSGCPRPIADPLPERRQAVGQRARR